MRRFLQTFEYAWSILIIEMLEDVDWELWWSRKLNSWYGIKREHTLAVMADEFDFNHGK